ncbi:MAG: LptF/LptG family permease [Candidatus Sumerlaeaceae bacterium]|nr:LptF/LptG family permease [Candidatus Sumerlaeaceae bacterium]
MRELFSPFFMGLGVFTFVFLVGQLYRLIDLLMTSGASPLLVGQLVLSLLPGILSLTTPMALLVAILMSVGRLSADREIIAVRMSGVNLMHIFAPILVVAGLLSALMIGANISLVPHLNLRATDLATQIEFNVLSSIPPNRFFELETSKEGQSSVFFYERRNPTTNQMEHINIKTTIEEDLSAEDEARQEQLREKMKKLAQSQDPALKSEVSKLKRAVDQAQRSRRVRESLIAASRGEIRADITARLITLELTNGSIHYVDVDRPTNYNVIKFDHFTKGIRPRMSRTDEGAYEKTPREMTVAELRQKISERLKSGKYRTELFQRFSIPLACIAFALVAIPLAVYVRPTAKAIAFGISFFLIFLYYGLLNYGISLGKTGSGVAGFAIFFPNILLALIGSLLMYRTVMK